MKSYEGETALFIACRRGKGDCVKKLLEEGANKNLPTNELISPLFEGSIFLPPANFVYGGYTVFTSVRVCIRPSITFCFLNILKSHGWNFIKPCKHIHIYKTKTFNKKVRASGQFY